MIENTFLLFYPHLFTTSIMEMLLTRLPAKRLTRVWLTTLLLLLVFRLPAQIITTVAGTGTAGYTGDNVQATNTALKRPGAIALDGSGNLFIADAENQRIRKVATNGMITTVAGSGTAGFSGDGGAAIEAKISNPLGVAVDGNGNLFIADWQNQRIRKVDSNGRITTVAGTGIPGFSGDGGPATSAQLYAPSGVAVDGNGNVYIVDNANHRIRKVDSNGRITTVAGTGIQGYNGDGISATSANLNFPEDVAVDGNGNLFIADLNNHRIRKVDVNGIITTVAGNGQLFFSGDGGPATAATLRYPGGVTLDGSGNLFISDQTNHRIRRVNTTGIISTIAGNGQINFSGDGGPATSAALSGPAGLAIDGSGNLFIADVDNHRIRRVSAPASVSIAPVNPGAVCSGSAFSLTATATNFTPTSYVWSSQPAGLAATGVTPAFTAPIVSSPTVYTLTVTATDGILSATGSITLTVNAMPDISLSPASVILTYNDPIQTLTAQSSAPMLRWSTGETTPTISVSTAGTYSVTATSSDGCTASAEAVVTSLLTPVTGPDCGYLVLNGASGHVEINGLDVVNNSVYDFPVFGSISFLMKPNSFVAGMTLVSTGNPANPTDGVRLWYDALGRLNLTIGNASDATTITASVPFSTDWQHIAAIWNQDDNTLELYHNGIRVADGISGGGVGALWPAGYQTVRIGAGKNAGQTFDGFIDDVAFWDKKLYSDDVSALIANGTTGTEESLRACYNLNRSGQGAGLAVTNNAVATAGLYNGVTVGTATAPRFVDSNCSTIVSVATTPLVSNSLCEGAPVSVSFTVSGTLTTGNTFSVELSDASGNFTGSPRVIGTASGTTVRTIMATLPDPLAAGTGYRIRVVASNPATIGTDNGENITVWQRAAITQQPASGSSVCAGASVVVPVSVTGTISSAQWYFRPPGLSSVLLTGQTSTTLTLSNVQAANAGQYELFIGGPCQSNVSTPFALTISSGVSITTQPASESSGCANTPVSVSVGAVGSGLTYQWYKGANPIPSQVTAVLSFPSAQPADNGTYYVVVRGNCGNPQTSQFFTLTISPRPVAPSLTAVSRVISTTSARPLSLLPFVNNAANNTLNFSGITGPVNPPVANISQVGTQSFSVTQTDLNGCTSPPTTFAITVQQSSTTSSASSQTVCRSSTVVLDAGVAGTRYEWYKNGTSAPFKLTEIKSIQRGTITASLTLVSVQTTATYYCQVFIPSGIGSFSSEWAGPFRVVVNSNSNCIPPDARLAAPEPASGKLSIQLLPNPIQDGQLRALITGTDNQPLSVQLLDTQGRVIRRQEWTRAGTDQFIEWDISTWSMGTYMLNARTPGQQKTSKLLKPD